MFFNRSKGKYVSVINILTLSGLKVMGYRRCLITLFMKCFSLFLLLSKCYAKMQIYYAKIMCKFKNANIKSKSNMQI